MTRGRAVNRAGVRGADRSRHEGRRAAPPGDRLAERESGAKASRARWKRCKSRPCWEVRVRTWWVWEENWWQKRPYDAGSSAA
eukprot:1532344-Pyramimonas_sp.AAC.1